MIRLVALLVCLTGPVAAQGYGLPPALAPCGEGHLDAARYRTDLQDLGWVFVPANARAGQLELLNDAFVSLVSGRDGPRDARLERGRAVWADLGVSQLVFTTPDGGQALMVAGGANADGVAQLRCWMAFADGTRMDDLFVQLLTQATDPPAPGDEQVLVLTQNTPGSDETLRLYLTRPAPGIDTPATRAGIATLLSVTPEAAQ
ncbi:hypothetical protein [Jannaschia donghaensis]|uniref:Uncharacterized protein n=1 Tax=Jannaschia donghaensis TaxID=420998 RepID=A0A0M6YIB6_9RHOB|nr:hypothetical protein [Jannaschia donghaensis]CTQ49017.1 hypothetical protein JDO7802_01025 [Jannaschia donghaensis]